MLFNPQRRDPQFWIKRGAPAGATVMLYVGRVSKEKDLDVIVSAWRKLGDRNTQPDAFPISDLRTPISECRLVFVGDGPYRTELAALLPDAIFTGTLAGQELARAFASADSFLCPSTTDTCGNVILEALAAGLPCVVSDQGGPKDLVTHGVTGFITRALDADDFARQTTRLLANTSLRHAMGIEAHRAVQDRDWADAARKFWAMSGG